MGKQDDLDFLSIKCSEIMDRFDSVQVFATRYEAGEKRTIAVHIGLGDWYARYGAATMWVEANQGTGLGSDAPGDDI